ncbi:MAG: hypothetical protein M0Z99_04515 [Betaproteobacteria bacterium]|nr:hypothetical protein [Betaproteobacteria bacterium]
MKAVVFFKNGCSRAVRLLAKFRLIPEGFDAVDNLRDSVPTRAARSAMSTPTTDIIAKLWSVFAQRDYPIVGLRGRVWVICHAG